MRPVLRLGLRLVCGGAVVFGCQRVEPVPEPASQRAPTQRAIPLQPGVPVPTPTPAVSGVASEAAPLTSSTAQRSVPPAAAAISEEPPTLRRLAVSGAIKDKEPVPLTAFKVNEPVVAFLELANNKPSEALVRVVFQHESGHEVGFVELAIPPSKPRWRTWAQTEMIKQPGKWTAIVRGANGVELGQHGFFVNPA